MNLAINKLNQVLTLLFFLINFYPFLYSQSSYYKVIGDDQLIAQLSYPVVVPSGDNSGLFLFSNNLDSGISLLKLDSCGKVNWGKNFTFGFNFPVIYDAIKVGEDELLLLSGELSNSVTYFLTRFSTKGELIVSWNLTMPEQFKPSSIEYLSNGNVLCNGLMTEGFFSNPVIFEFKLEDGQVIKSKKFSILSESANAKGLKTGKIILVTDHNMILLDENWNPDWSVKINASLTGSTLPYFSTVKPSVENGKIATLCFTDVLNNYFLIFDDQGQLMKTSKPFAADLPVNTTFGIVLSFFSRSSIHYLPDNTYMFVLNAYRNGDSWPTIYKFNDSAEKVFENAFSDSTFLTSSQKISKDYSLYILGSGRLTKNITLLHTNPQLQVGCMDFFNLPNVFGQIERTFWTTEDTLPHSEELYIQVDPIIPEEDPMGEINEEVLCQSYYGPPLPDIVIDTFICLGAEIDLSYTHPTGTVIWEDGSTDSLFSVREPGQYRATVHHCGTTQQVIFNVPDGKCPCVFEMPNAFTPNGDGVNDTFGPVYQCYFSDYRLRVYNRWGQEVFSGTDPAQGWDGRTGGAEAPSEVYMWQVSYTAWHEGQQFSRSARGEVTLLR